MSDRESFAERKYVKYVEDDGGKVHKLQKDRGWPDRLTATPNGLGMFYLEFKKKNKMARKLQQHMHKQIKEMGYVIFVTDSLEEAVAIYEEFKRLSAARLSEKVNIVPSSQSISRTIPSTRTGKNDHIIDSVQDTEGEGDS